MKTGLWGLQIYFVSNILNKYGHFGVCNPPPPPPHYFRAERYHLGLQPYPIFEKFLDWIHPCYNIYKQKFRSKHIGWKVCPIFSSWFCMWMMHVVKMSNPSPFQMLKVLSCSWVKAVITKVKKIKSTTHGKKKWPFNMP